MAHHVPKKATRGHNAYRPRKSRPSDIYRKPPSYPALPDLPVFTKIDGPSSHSRQTVTIEIAPEDTAETLRAKVTAAGGAAPEEFTYAGQALTSSLAIWASTRRRALRRMSSRSRHSTASQTHRAQSENLIRHTSCPPAAVRSFCHEMWISPLGAHGLERW